MLAEHRLYQLLGMFLFSVGMMWLLNSDELITPKLMDWVMPGAFLGAGFITIVFSFSFNPKHRPDIRPTK